jgi:hypothetical protein
MPARGPTRLCRSPHVYPQYLPPSPGTIAPVQNFTAADIFCASLNGRSACGNAVGRRRRGDPVAVYDYRSAPSFLVVSSEWVKRQPIIDITLLLRFVRRGNIAIRKFKLRHHQLPRPKLRRQNLATGGTASRRRLGLFHPLLAEPQERAGEIVERGLAQRVER